MVLVMCEGAGGRQPAAKKAVEAIKGLNLFVGRVCVWLGTDYW